MMSITVIFAGQPPVTFSNVSDINSSGDNDLRFTDLDTNQRHVYTGCVDFLVVSPIPA